MGKGVSEESRWKLQAATITLVGAAVIFAAFWQLQTRLGRNASSSTNESDAADLAARQEIAVAVEAAPARIGDLVMRISATGQTRALREMAISPKIPGAIVQLPVNEGQNVHQGDLLLKLDDREYRLAVAEAQDRLLGAQVDFGMLQREEKRGESAEDTQVEEGGNVRLDELKQAEYEFLEKGKKYEQGQISEDEFLRAKLKYETAQALAGKKREELLAHRTGLTAAELALQRAELSLSHTEIRAPFSGVIADLQVQKGQQISAGQECFKLVDLSQMEVEVQVLESEIGLVEEGRKAEVTFPAYPGETFPGRVTSINPVVDRESKTVKVTVRLANPHRQILPGMFAYAKLEAQIFKDRLLVPKEAVLTRDQRKLVFILRDGLAKWCYVETGLENEEFAEILDSSFGLQPGEMVITAGHYTLVHDARVRLESE
jgi:HlyD family secretion protein